MIRSNAPYHRGRGVPIWGGAGCLILTGLNVQHKHQHMMVIVCRCGHGPDDVSTLFWADTFICHDIFATCLDRVHTCNCIWPCSKEHSLQWYSQIYCMNYVMISSFMPSTMNVSHDKPSGARKKKTTEMIQPLIWPQHGCFAVPRSDEFLSMHHHLWYK